MKHELQSLELLPPFSSLPGGSLLSHLSESNQGCRMGREEGSPGSHLTSILCSAKGALSLSASGNPGAASSGDSRIYMLGLPPPML